MKRYIVTYKITHKRDFWVHDINQIKTFFTPENHVEIIDIEEAKVSDPDFKEI